MVRYVPRPPVDDPWQGESSFPPIIFTTSQIPPLKPNFWKYNYDDAAFWVGTPNLDIPPVRYPAGGGIPFKPPYWKFHYDDASYWVGTPNTRIPPIDDPVGGGFPFKPPYWKYDNDDPGFWVGDKSVGAFLARIPITMTITSTNTIQLPINAVLMGQQLFAEEKPNAFGPGKVGRLSKNAPSFTVTTTKKGYD